MQRLIATRNMTYATRRLQAGDVFYAKPNEARLLIAIKKAREDREPGKVPPPPQSLMQKVSGEDDMKALRTAYQKKMGKRPYNGWDAAELQRRIDEALAS